LQSVNLFLEARDTRLPLEARRAKWGDTFMLKQAHVIISGYVHGVGYRYFIRSNARKLGLTGWVRNLPRLTSGKAGTSNGKVEAFLQGTREQIEEMLALARQGPMLSEVRDIQVEWDPAERSGQDRFDSFEIRK
jgi:acylphosphatase